MDEMRSCGQLVHGQRQLSLKHHLSSQYVSHAHCFVHTTHLQTIGLPALPESPTALPIYLRICATAASGARQRTHVGQERGRGVDGRGTQRDVAPQAGSQLVRHPHLAARGAADDEAHNAFALQDPCTYLAQRCAILDAESHCFFRFQTPMMKPTMRSPCACVHMPEPKMCTPFCVGILLVMCFKTSWRQAAQLHLFARLAIPGGFRLDDCRAGRQTYQRRTRVDDDGAGASGSAAGAAPPPAEALPAARLAQLGCVERTLFAAPLV